DGVRYERGDMRELGFDAEFDAALCFWGSFGYFERDGDLAQARSAARALRKGGRYLFDAPTVETILTRFRERNWFEVGDSTVLQETAFVPGTGRVETTWTFLREGAQSRQHSSMRLYSLHELTDLLTEA